MADVSFVDEAVIEIASGSGGDGAVAYRREKYVPNGGPAGGDGGRGGSVVFIAEPGMSTLHAFRHRRKVAAEHGQPGGTARKTGASGDDAVVSVPLGTLLFDLDAEDEARAAQGATATAAGAAHAEDMLCEPLADLSEAGQRFVAAKGGP